MNEIYINHKDWEGICYLKNDTIYRKDFINEYGKFIIFNNKLTIKWEKWNEEIFYCYDNNNYYYKDIFNQLYDNIYIFDENNLILVILNNKNECVLYKESIVKNTYIKYNDVIIFNNSDKLIFKKINNNIYCTIDDYYQNIYFELKIINNSITENYIFNKITKYFYNDINPENKGVYEIIDNCIDMKWNNNYCKKFYSNKYISYEKINKNINIIKPINIFIEDKVLFSNISLCKQKIILSSMHYKKNNWNLNLLDINVYNCNIISKIILDNNDEYESSTTIILEIDKLVENIFIKIIYNKSYLFNIYLEQLNIVDHYLSAMTLFKDDYLLLKRYLKYYNELGIEVFFLYYNKKIDYLFLEEINKLNEYNLKIYLIEWDYIYWWKDDTNIKYHHAQLMAINNSLNILKNYGNYTLYNDMDEYICNTEFKNFNELININLDIDIFIFKNRFCKMGNELIKYKDFDEKFDLKNIIEGNYYPEYREKLLIKLNSVNVMGVHKCFKKYNNNDLKDKIVSQFYHIINFEEKYRENLMTEYIF